MAEQTAQGGQEALGQETLSLGLQKALGAAPFPPRSPSRGGCEHGAQAGEDRKARGGDADRATGRERGRRAGERVAGRRRRCCPGC